MILESGETIEECVKREVAEEVGIKVHEKDIRYVCSMPWPTEIASNLMIGCWTDTKERNFKIDTHELEDARWFSKETIKEILQSQADTTIKPTTDFILPGHWTTAHKLLTHWVTKE
eukprot:TRINITY_DN8624_c0_g1_i3.p1 TRINITY_DN8624_c0_g1~~TRINITY_DN8624_c0_g1_i3.p1  ORF type:complete len:116 (-),score=25.97 TRINITY_DN8624_c0_g1_i3:13-360(-)